MAHSTPGFDLILKGGRIIDPKNSIDQIGDVGFRDGKVASVLEPLPGDAAARVVDVAGCIVAPGLVDLHAHVYVHGTSLGVDPSPVARTSGTTTFVDAGSAGAANFAGFRRHVIAHADIRVLAFLNISFPGIFGFYPGVNVGECLDLRLLHAGECLRVARENQDLIVGVKVRVGLSVSGSLGITPMNIAMDVADELQQPLMVHIGTTPPTIDEVLDRLRPGDILTHCFRPFPNTVVDGNDVPRPAFLRAQARGVLFDIGHGSGSFGFDTCRAMIANDIPPDIISSDIHVLSIKGPVYDLLVTASKFLNLGMDEKAILAAVTTAPAASIGRQEEFGHLGIGAAGDAAVLKIATGSFEFEDSTGAKMTGSRRFELQHTVAHGALLT
jgi:dihydroorotase